MNTAHIEKLVVGGQGLAHVGGKPHFLWNALPGELVEFDVTRKKRSHNEGVVTRVLNASAERVAPHEEHFLSCSPWQMMSFEAENKHKIALAHEAFGGIGRVALTRLDIASDGAEFGYRNKMEYSFFEHDVSGVVDLGFFIRGKHYKTPLEHPCGLAYPHLNTAALRILKWVHAKGLTRKELKSVIIRANKNGETVAALFLKATCSINDHPAFEHGLQGFHVYFSNPKSPSSVATALLYSQGIRTLHEHLGEAIFEYDVLSFFQVNVPVFEMALHDISAVVPRDAQVLDLYAGVGSIGLSLAKTSGIRCELVDCMEESIRQAQENILHNNLQQRCSAHGTPAEKSTERITSEKTIIVDPPRAGLHKKVIDRLLEEKPKRIVYLSCNVATQARDVAFLRTAYRISFARLYNFFPKTPHIESLLVLDAY